MRLFACRSEHQILTAIPQYSVLNRIDASVCLMGSNSDPEKKKLSRASKMELRLSHGMPLNKSPELNHFR